MQTKSPRTDPLTEAEESALLSRSFAPPPGANGQFHSFQAQLGESVAKVKQSAGAANAYVHAQPWKAIGAAAAGGLLLGLLLARRA